MAVTNTLNNRSSTFTVDNLLTVTANNVVISAGNLTLPNTISAGTSGEIIFGGSRFISNYGTANTFVGATSGNTTLTTGSSTGNTSTGFNSLLSLTTSANNTGIGFASLTALTSGAAGQNTSVGSAAGSQLVTGQYNSLLGFNAGINYTGSESSNICIGSAVQGTVGESNTIRIGNYGTGAYQENKCYIAATYSNFGTQNTFVGEASGNLTLTTGSSLANVGVGALTLTGLTTGAVNTMVGNQCGQIISTGTGNCGLGNGSLVTLNTGIQNVAIGASTLSVATSAGANTCVGYVSGGGLLTGTNNTSLGASSGGSWTGAESNNIAIGNTGVAGDSGKIRIGTNGTHTSCIIQGIQGVTVANQNIVTINTSTGQLGSSGGLTSSSVIGTVPHSNLSSAASILFQGPYGTGSATENFEQFTMPMAATFTNLYVTAVTNASTSNCTVTLRVNGANTALVATVTALTTGNFTDLTHSVTCVAGDLISWSVQQGTVGVIVGSISMKITG